MRVSFISQTTPNVSDISTPPLTKPFSKIVLQIVQTRWLNAPAIRFIARRDFFSYLHHTNIRKSFSTNRARYIAWGIFSHSVCAPSLCFTYNLLTQDFNTLQKVLTDLSNTRNLHTKRFVETLEWNRRRWARNVLKKSRIGKWACNHKSRGFVFTEISRVYYINGLRLSACGAAFG